MSTLTGTTSSPSTPHGALPALTVMVEKDLEVLVHRFLARKRDDLERARAALATGDFETIRRIGHDLKGAGEGFGFPDISGVDVLKRIRNSSQSALPILFVTARNREDDVVTALRQGADDYMVKPVRRLELLARLEAIARRGKHRSEQPEVIELDVYR